MFLKIPVVRHLTQLSGVFLIVGALSSTSEAVAQTPLPPSPPAADAEYLANWGLKMINALPAYLKGFTGKGVIVAVSDTGLDILHPEFGGRISPLGRNFGVDQADYDVAPTIDGLGGVSGHGTHVAGIIGAARDGKGMQGVAYESTILPLRSLEIPSDGVGEPTIQALYYAADKGAQVLNGSYGPPVFPAPYLDPNQDGVQLPNPDYKVLDYHLMVGDLDSFADEYKALSYAAKKDVVLVFAAGNDRVEQPGASTSIPTGNGMMPLITPDYIRSGKIKFLDQKLMSDDDMLQNPNTYKFVDPSDPRIATMDYSDLKGSLMAVVALGHDGKIAAYSNLCGDAAEWCLAAPGGSATSDADNINSTWPLNDAGQKGLGYKAIAGTSMASPHVAGAAAVVRSAFPFMNARQTIETILTTTTKKGYEDQGIYGQGLLNLGAAVDGPMAFRYKGVFDVDTKGYSAVWSNPISGPGDLTKRGSGTLVLSGQSMYDGPTVVVGGTLAVEGSITSSATVSDGGRLGGIGRTGDVTIDRDGILAPGSVLKQTAHIGTLTVQGNLTFKPGSVYEVEVQTQSNVAGHVHVTGSAILDGGTVLHVGEDGIYNPLSVYRILTADTIVSGKFADMRSTFAFLNPTLLYESSNKAVDLQLLRNDVKFADKAETDNQKATAQALDSLTIGGSALYNSVVSLSDNAKQIIHSYDQLSGEAYASVKGMFINDSIYARSAVYNRLQQAEGGIVTTSNAELPISKAPSYGPQNYVAWGSAFGGWATYRSDRGDSKAKSTIGGLMTGIDAAVYENWRLGILAGYSQSTYKVERLSSSFNSDNYSLGGYAGTEWPSGNDKIIFNSGFAYTWHQVDVARNVAIKGFGDHLNANYNANTFQIFGELGYAHQLTDQLLIEPYANLAYVRLKSDGFAEKGLNGAALNILADSFDATMSTLGMRFEHRIDLGGTGLTTRADFGWRHAFGDTSPLSTAQFAIGSNSFTTGGGSVGKDVALIEAGFDVQLSKNATLGVSYQGQFGDGAARNGVNSKFSVRF